MAPDAKRFYAVPNGRKDSRSSMLHPTAPPPTFGPPLQNGLPHGLMQAHRERHTPTRRKRGALLEQYDPLPEHGNRKAGR